MKKLAVICPALAAAALAVALVARTPPPVFTGKRLPLPPRQQAPWVPPETKLPEGLVLAAKVLFEQGFADPRGCEYREIGLQTGSCWAGDAGIVKTRGWVLAPKPHPQADTEPRHAVAWNGLVYPVASLGGKADVRADVEKLLARDRVHVQNEIASHEEQEAASQQVAAAKGQGYSYSSPHVRWHKATSEPASVSHATMLPIKAPLLLRLGHADLAERLWDQWYVCTEKEDREEPYLLLAKDWVWALYDRAVCAHMRGDDELAFVSGWMLYHIQRRVEAEARRIGFERADEEEQRVFLDFLGRLGVLIADQERRAREPKSERVLEAGLDKFPDRFPDRQGRIAALIRDLEEVAARQWAQPGGVSLGGDPIVQALIKEGDDAVEPLLRCLAEDDRLTRSVHFWRDFSYHRTIMGVHEAAYVALAGIMQTSFFEARSTGDNLTSRGREGRRQVAADIRAFWRKLRGVPLEERWYRTLADDTALADRWIEAAEHIAQPTNVMTIFGSTVWSSSWSTQPAAGEQPKLRGEVLRSKTGPSVSELLVKRMRDLATRRGEERNGYLRRARALALALADWDAGAARDELRWLTSSGAVSAGLFEKRAEIGDEKALDDYAEWVRAAGWKGSGDKVFRLMWRNPDHPAIMRTAEWLFSDSSSPWVAQAQEGDARLRGYDGLARTPLLGIAAFREYVIGRLGVKAAAGRAWISRGGSCIESRGNSTSICPAPVDDPYAPPPGEMVKFRSCDDLAAGLSETEGTPLLRVFWRERKRDEVIGRLVAFLRRYGGRFRYAPHPDRDASSFFPDSAFMTFPKLGSPATAEDVRKGLAIFSLEGEGERRLRKAPSFPVKAGWVTLKDYPDSTSSYDPDTGEETTRIDYERDGFVWQAEEVLKGGRWERYFGFVGKYVVARVPASEIEFPAEDEWSRLSSGLGCRIVADDMIDKGYGEPSTRVDLGAPAEIALMLRNQRGTDRRVPRVFYRKRPGRGPELRPGIAVELLRRLEGPKRTVPDPQSAFPIEEEVFDEVEPKPLARFDPDDEARELGPTEEMEALRLDLRDLFEIATPGTYSVRVKFTEDSGLGAGRTEPLKLQVREAKKRAGPSR